MSFDNVCKLLAEKYPADFVRWLIAEESLKGRHAPHIPSAAKV